MRTGVIILATFLAFTATALAYPGFQDGLDAFASNYTGAPVERLGGAFLPAQNETQRVLDDWFSIVSDVKTAIGSLPGAATDPTVFENSAESADELVALAAAAKDEFLAFVDGIAATSGASILGRAFVLKSPESLRRKIDKKLDDGISAPWKKIGDAVRTTLVCDDPLSLSTAVSELTSGLLSGGAAAIDSKWHTATPDIEHSGYVGVHGDVLFVLGDGRTIITEIQFHFPSIFDGTLCFCPKEYSHGIFEITRVVDKANPIVAEGNSAQRLIFAFGASRIELPGGRRLVRTREIRDVAPAFTYDDGTVYRPSNETDGFQFFNVSGCQWVEVRDRDEAYDVLTTGNSVTEEMVASLIDCNGAVGFAASLSLAFVVALVAVFGS